MFHSYRLDMYLKTRSQTYACVSYVFQLTATAFYLVDSAYIKDISIEDFWFQMMFCCVCCFESTKWFQYQLFSVDILRTLTYNFKEKANKLSLYVSV